MSDVPDLPDAPNIWAIKLPVGYGVKVVQGFLAIFRPDGSLVRVPVDSHGVPACALLPIPPQPVPVAWKIKVIQDLVSMAYFDEEHGEESVSDAT